MFVSRVLTFEGAYIIRLSKCLGFTVLKHIYDIAESTWNPKMNMHLEDRWVQKKNGQIKYELSFISHFRIGTRDTYIKI